LGSGQAGVPIVWTFSNVAYPHSGFTATLNPASSVTTSSGASTTFTPSNYATDATAIVATIGTAANHATSTTVTTQAGAPTEVSFYFKMGGTTYASDYLTNHTTVASVLYANTAGEVTLSLSDAFTNPVAFSVAITNITLTGVGGQFLSGTNLYSTISCGTVVAGNSHFTCPASGTSLTLPFNYLQSTVYGAVGEVAGSIYEGATQYTGSSGNIVTGTLATLGQTMPTSATTTKAGSSVLVQEFVGIAQSGVPISLNLCTSPCATSTSYNAKFSNGLSTITLTTNSSGGVESLVAVNTTAGSVAYFNATAPAPLTSSPSRTIASAISASVTTIPGPISTLVVNIAGNVPPSTGPNIKWIVNGSTAYADAAYADAFNNLVTTAPSNQIQIGLVASVGALSATQVYIASGQLSTNASGSFGSILWTLPSTVGTTATLTASANVNGKAVQGVGTLTTVSAYPTINVTSPVSVSGTLYSSTAFVTFHGIANATAGSASTTIATIGYKVGTGGWQSITTASLHNYAWTVPIVLAAGLNTVTFNTTDSAGFTTVTPALTVLVDTSAPTFGAITAPANKTSVVVNVTSAEGDLNLTSVAATINGVAVSNSSIAVSGTNNPGHSVTYTITISAAAGSSTVVVSAATLAGLSGSATATVTVTGVPVATSSTFTFTSITAGTSPVSNKGLNTTIANGGSSAFTAYVYAVIKDTKGATVYIGVANFGSVAAGSSANLNIPLVLASGSYTATLYVDNAAGTPLAQPSSPVSFTV